MELKQWFDGASEEERSQLARAAGTDKVYLRQVATGFRKPSPKLCINFIKAEPRFTLRGLNRPDLAELCELVCCKKRKAKQEA